MRLEPSLKSRMPRQAKKTTRRRLRVKFVVRTKVKVLLATGRAATCAAWRCPRQHDLDVERSRLPQEPAEPHVRARLTKKTFNFFNFFKTL